MSLPGFDPLYLVTLARQGRVRATIISARNRNDVAALTSIVYPGWELLTVEQYTDAPIPKDEL